MKKIAQFLFFIAFAALQTSNAQWSECNNGMYGGLTTCFTVHDNYLFAGAFGGIYRSSDEGKSWEVIRNGLPLLPVRSLLVIGNNIFAATVKLIWI